MTKKLFTAIIALIATYITTSAEVPEGYYSAIEGKAEATLKTTLHQIINPHTEVSSYQNLPTYFKQTDVYPGTSYWWDMYSDNLVSINSSFGSSGMNREHSLPKSWWGGDDDIPAYVDLFHLYPSNASANSAKSNYPLGEILAGTTPKFDNGTCRVGTGINSGGATYVFEPANEYKGDFARTYFYMVTCYQNLTWESNYTWQVKNGAYPSLQPWAIDLLLKWHRADPVSEKETNRNEAVYNIQSNRNPFIDYPELAEYIWGDKKGQTFYFSDDDNTQPSNPVLYSPINGSTIDFGEIAFGNSATTQIIFRGENLSGTFELGISGTNRSLFTLSAKTLSADAANTTSGTAVTITYTPTATGTHTAQLNITDGGLPAAGYKITLTAKCLEKPSLSQLTATEATDVTESSYTANWDPAPSNETIDGYILTIKRYNGNTVTTFEEEIEPENCEFSVTGLNEGDYDTYAVQSVRLGLRSDISNYIKVTPIAGIDNIIADEPLAIESGYGFIRFRCSMPQYRVNIYDLTGRTIASLNEIRDYQEFPLPRGIYFVKSESHKQPVKTIVF